MSHCSAFHTGRNVLYVYPRSRSVSAASASSRPMAAVVAVLAAFAGHAAHDADPVPVLAPPNVAPPVALICWNPPQR